MGKTQVAVEYAYRFRLDYEAMCVVPALDDRAAPRTTRSQRTSPVRTAAPASLSPTSDGHSAVRSGAGRQ
ncbi:hypothetical protein ACH419_32130 [Streptomyces bobili]|uniref:hypothetical protein n=1 Tax=Streptomyces bobili TaxID=67280 RepID=UPI0037AAFFF4